MVLMYDSLDVGPLGDALRLTAPAPEHAVGLESAGVALSGRELRDRSGSCQQVGVRLHSLGLLAGVPPAGDAAVEFQLADVFELARDAQHVLQHAVRQAGDLGHPEADHESVMVSDSAGVAFACNDLVDIRAVFHVFRF